MRLSEVCEANLGIFRRKIPDNRCYLSWAKGESLQDVAKSERFWVWDADCFCIKK